MALQQTIVNKSGITITDAYRRVYSLGGSKDQLTVTVKSYVDKNAFANNLQEVQEDAFCFVPSVADGASDFYTQAYEYLKNLPEFSGAIDC